MGARSKLSAAERAELYSDVRKLSFNEQPRPSRRDIAARFERFDRLHTINRIAQGVATTSNPRAVWTDLDTARIILELFESTDDQDFTRRGVLAIKIMSGYRAAPDASALLSDREERPTWGEFVANNATLFDKTAKFENSIDIRRIFAAHLYGGKTKNHFSRDMPNFAAAADEFLGEVFRRVEDAASRAGHLANSRSGLFVDAEAGSGANEVVVPAEKARQRLVTPEADDADDTNLIALSRQPEEVAASDARAEVVHSSGRPRPRSLWRWALPGVAALVIVAFGAVWWNLHLNAPAASSGDVGPLDEVSSPRDAVVTNFHQVPLDPRCPDPQPDPDREVRILLAERGGCWSSSVRLTDGRPVYAFVHFKSRAAERQDNVTATLDLPSGVTAVEGTTYWGNYAEPTGTLAVDALVTEDGINVGSYTPGANVWWLVELAASGSDECGGEIRAVVSTSEPRSDLEDSAFATLVPCVR